MAEVEARLLRLEGNVTNTELGKLVLSELGIEKVPQPLELSSPAIVKEPLLVLLYCEREGIKSRDLEEIHGDEAPLFRGVRRSLVRAYSTAAHQPNDWVLRMLDRLMGLMISMIRTYCLVLPISETGIPLAFEPADAVRLVKNVRENRRLARELIQQLDEDFAAKNAGRAAAAVIRGARNLHHDMFAPQDAWLFKKAASRISTAGAGDKESHGRDGREYGRGGRGRGRGRGRGGFGKRSREEADGKAE